jgi:D-beta-D-heptose 7-phosphate kinase/D-beta-D-heptose 1-phosphate adenosyltransferase
MDCKIVFTNGCFDILHAGHIELLRKAKQLGNVLHVGINSDESIRNIKGKGRPIVPEHYRFEMLAAIKYVDFVHIFDKPTPINLIRKLDPDIVVKGGDWEIRDVVSTKRAEIVIIPIVNGFSTSKLIKRILENENL